MPLWRSTPPGTPEDDPREPRPLPSPQDLRVLLGTARRAVAAAAGLRPGPEPDPTTLPPVCSQTWASFVTLTQAGRLRGCIGSLEPRRALVEDVAQNARAAATRDPRFPPVAPEELDDLEIEVSVLGPVVPLPVTGRADALDRLHPGMGAVLRYGGRRGTLLPQVWSRVAGAEEFLDVLLAKAGLPPGFWSEQVELATYGVVEVREGET
ncbi:AmmeMemoRadiSam system protein A [Isoptericola sp. b441]|uniref:AmmeMemoRadiSam system protein A n=1 Tax=Actinotalea lenta TaxID=3064654 RepID=A0ABT9DEB7_9CELL|nr:AmmeMemoRadiSam system protein A [Isoptericola sp. b441]MDO8107861.1 AmmeMemoRadiSam system protein A [Isoptericola sp. b441]